MSKTVGGVTHTYLLDGAKILRETWGENALEMLWDNEDAICGIKYNGTPYYFLKNLQGDVIAITDDNGAVVARYSYDAWGVPAVVSDTTAVGIATVNPFRYRGYYYDSETQLYYLQSRYYNPAVGRFVNADEADNVGVSNSILSHNLYAYAQNDPVDNIDYGGFFSWVIFKDLIQRIAALGKDLLEFVLSHYGISKKAYAKRTKYKEPGKLLELVNTNKSQIKHLKSGFTDISKFIDIVLTVADCAAILKSDHNTVVKIADLMFYGIIRLIGYLGSKLISWILSKVFVALCWAKFIIEQLLNILVDWILNSKWVKKLNKKFLYYIDVNSLTIGGYITAIFKGAKDCLA